MDDLSYFLFQTWAGFLVLAGCCGAALIAALIAVGVVLFIALRRKKDAEE